MATIRDVAKMAGVSVATVSRVMNQSGYVNKETNLIVKGDFSIESGLKSVYSLLQNHPDIDGIFAANDLMAIGCLKGLLRSGKKVPEDVALIGFDDISLAHIMEPEISTIQQPFAEIAQFAVQQLIQKIESNITPAVQTNEVIELDVRLIQRASTQR